jgi:hypothetical protein
MLRSRPSSASPSFMLSRKKRVGRHQSGAWNYGRQKQKLILDDLEHGLQSELPKLPGQTLSANAILFALTRIKRLRTYLAHGFLELDNNTTERSLRGIAIGRKITCS